MREAGRRRRGRRIAIRLLPVLAALTVVPVAHARADRVDRIAGSTPAAVATGKAVRVRRLDPNRLIGLTITLRPRRQAELKAVLGQIERRGSPRFHRFLTFAQWKRRYAPTTSEVAAVAGWARAHQLTVAYRFRSNLALKVAGNVAEVERAFGLRLNQYELHGQRFFSNDRDPAIARRLRGVVGQVVGLNGLQRFSPAIGPESSPLALPHFRRGPFRVAERSLRGSGKLARFTGSAAPNLCCRNSIALEPTDLYSSEAYDWNALRRVDHCCNPTNNPGGTPREQSIAIIGAHGVNYADLLTFFTDYGLAYNVNQITFGDTPCCSSASSMEMTLDLEYAVAMSNSFLDSSTTAHVFAYEGGDNDPSGLLDAWEGALSDNQTRTASTSFGAYEYRHDNSGFEDVITAMSAMGWSIVAAAGDHGAYDDCTNAVVQYPAVSWSVTAIGGTTLVFSSGKPLKFGSETAWNGDGCGGKAWPGNNDGGGGGGCSIFSLIPPWQSLAVTGCPGTRAVPDIALNSGNGQTMYFSGNGTGWQNVGGTSIAAPEVAGFLADANAYARTLGPICGTDHDQYCSPLGNINPPIWFQGIGSVGNKNPFYDVTSGCNGGLAGGAGGYCASSGYDKATGWGSANMLAFAWLLNEWGVSAGAGRPTVDFGAGNPAVNSWSNTDQRVSFAVHSPAVAGTDRSPGVAGFTAKWDSDPGSPYGHATPGSGDPFYDGPSVLGTNGFLTLKNAGPGCHTAYVRAWDNLGAGTLGKYGPVCYDPDPPNVVCSPPDRSIWRPINFDVLCHADDAVSGLANPDDDLIVLMTNVPPGTETATAFTDDRIVFDKAGNATEAGPFGPFMIDRKPPTIAISSPSASTYVLNQQVDAAYSCEDDGSGLASCDGPVLSGKPIDTASVGTKTFTVKASDAVDNGSVSSVDYNVSYRICPLYDPTKASGGGAYTFRLTLCDANGANVSTMNIAVKATAVDGDPARARPQGNLNPGNVFLYGPGSAPGASYLYVLDTRGLARGSHVLDFTVQGDPTVHTAPFILK
jgi:Pro-kumamolisin, activation domain/Subtilase family